MEDGPWIVTDAHTHTTGGEHIVLYRIVDPDPFSLLPAEWLPDRTPSGKRLFKLKALPDAAPDRAARPAPKAAPQSKVAAAAAASHRRRKRGAAVKTARKPMVASKARAKTQPKRAQAKKAKATRPQNVSYAELEVDPADVDDATHMRSICVLAFEAAEARAFSTAYILDDGTCCGVDGTAFGFIDLDSLEAGDAEANFLGALTDGLDNRCIVLDEEDDDLAYLDLGRATIHEESGTTLYEIKPSGKVLDNQEDVAFTVEKCVARLLLRPHTVVTNLSALSPRYTHHAMKLAALFLVLLVPQWLRSTGA